MIPSPVLQRSERRRGFTLIELLVVVTILVLLVAMLIPSVEKSMDMARRAVCGSRGHAMMIAVLNYGSDNLHDVPAHAGDVGNWLWDVNANTVRALLAYGAGGADQRALFHCPTNLVITYDEEWLNGWRETATDPDGASGPASGFLVVSYQWTMRRPSGPQFVGYLSGAGTQEYSNGYEARIKVTDSGAVARTPFISDNVTDIYWQNRWADGEFEGRRYGSSHMEGDRRGALPVPAGGNLSFIDGHVQWRDLAEMSYNYAGVGPLWHW